MPQSKYRVKNPVSIGIRRERDEELVLDDARAAAIGAHHLERIGPATPAPADGNDGEGTQNDSQPEGEGEGATPAPADGHEDQTYRELQEACKERELSAAGTHAELVERLRLADADRV